MKKKVSILLSIIALLLFPVSSVFAEAGSVQTKIIAHDFSPDSNQKETNFGFSYEVPSSWRKDVVDNYIYYYPEDGILYMTVASGMTVPSDDESRESFVTGIASGLENFSEIDRYETYLSDRTPALSLEFTATISSIDVNGYSVFFNGPDGYVSFMYCDYASSAYDRSKDFNEIVKSLQPASSDSEQPAPVEEPDVNDSSADVSSTEDIPLEYSNALSKARSYLDFSSFSYTGLIGQLEYEGFSTEACTYAADNCGADWNEQAALKAESYMEFDSFSRDGLIEQLLYEGFSQEQAEYGVTAIGY